MGFDTSKMPEDYDPDATTNPYGADVATLNEVDELLLFNQAYSVIGTGTGRTDLYGHNRKLNGEMDEFLRDPLNNPVDESKNFLHYYDFVDAVKLDINGDGRDSAVAVLYTHYNFTRFEDSDDDGDY